MTVTSILEFLTLLVLAATFPLSVIAVYGFRGAPFGRVLRPLPVVFIGYILYIMPQFVPVDPPLLFYAIVSTGAVFCILVAAAEAALLLTERRGV